MTDHNVEYCVKHPFMNGWMYLIDHNCNRIFYSTYEEALEVATKWKGKVITVTFSEED